jgi:hypothetical protein
VSMVTIRSATPETSPPSLRAPLRV